MTSKTPHPQLPCNLEAERAVLGSLLIDPEAAIQIEDQLIASDFYREAHQLIYAMIVHLVEQHIPADFVTVCDALQQRHQLEVAGGPSYLASLSTAVPTSGNLSAYAGIVARTALLRRLIAFCGQVAARAYADDEAQAFSILEQAEQHLFELGQRVQGMRSQTVTSQEVMVAHFDWLEQAMTEQGALRGIPTGLHTLDRLLEGLHPCDLIILAGRPGQGKTALALSIALHAAGRAGHKVGLVSLEMSLHQLGQRLLAMEGRLDLQTLRHARLEEEECGVVINASARLAATPLWLMDASALSTAELRRTARYWHRQFGIELLIVDYLQLLHATPPDGRPFKNREQEVATISRALKALARELQIPVLALAQLSRAVESRANKVPQLSDLRESGSIEADSDVVLLLSREEGQPGETALPGTAEVIVAKHRNGPVGSVRLFFEKAQARFRDTSLPPASTIRVLRPVHDDSAMEL